MNQKITAIDVRRKLKSGRISARKVERCKDGVFLTEYLPTIGGIWIGTVTGDRFPSRAEAIEAASTVKTRHQQPPQCESAARVH